MEIHCFSELEAKFERSLHCTSLLLANENARLPRLQLLLSEHDKDTISEQLYQAKRQLEDAETENSRIREQSIRMQQDMDELHRSFQLKTKMIDTLQAELSSMRSSSVEMSKLQVDNANLAREVSSMKPELTRLRSQNSSYQSVLSEKLSLERQVSLLEVELRDAKRKSEKGRISNIPEKTATSLEHANVTAQNQTSQSDAQGATVTLPKKQAKPRSQNKNLIEPSGDPPLRQRFGEDPSIGTPGPNQLSKLPTRIAAAPGDKSIFSITPFLNRQSNDFEVDFTSSESDGDGISFAESGPSGIEVKGLPLPKNGLSTTNSRKSIAQPQRKPPKSNTNSKSTNLAASRITKRTQKQKNITEPSSEGEELPDPAKKRRVLQTIGENPSIDGNFGAMRTLSKQPSLSKNQSDTFANTEGKHVENDRRNRRLGLNKALDIPPFSPLKRNARAS
ncbi:putative 21S rRNA (uridine(2791)-2'-O)-methyltransferase [Microsporum audouinii]